MPPSATQNEYKRNFTELDTEYLIGLWDKSTDDQFTPEGIAALREVIVERLGFLPTRGIPYGPPRSTGSSARYDRGRLESLSSRLDTLSTVCLGLAALALISGLGGFVYNLAGYIGQSSGRLTPLEIVLSIGAGFGSLQGALLLFILVYVLRTLAEGSLLLIDLETNTRGLSTSAEAPAIDPPPSSLRAA